MDPSDIDATSERIGTGELLSVAATIRDNGGWHIAALKVEASAALIGNLLHELAAAKEKITAWNDWAEHKTLCARCVTDVDCTCGLDELLENV